MTSLTHSPLPHGHDVAADAMEPVDAGDSCAGSDTDRNRDRDAQRADTQWVTWQQLIWLGMAMAVPAAWEILQHARDPKRGRLVFADRRRGRLHVAWAEAKRAPDTKRLIEDYKARDLQEDAATQFSSLGTLAGWRGYRRRRADEVVTRAGRFDDIHMRWIEVTLAWPEGVDRKVERGVLEQFNILDDRHGPTHWRAFGMDFRIPAGMVLKGTEIRPGSASLRFSDDKRLPTEVEVRRLGAADAWYDGDPQALIAEQLPKSDWRFERRPYRGRMAVVGSTRQPSTLWRRLIGRKRMRYDMVWTEGSHRILHVTTISPQRSPLEPEQVEVCDVVPASPRQEGRS